MERSAAALAAVLWITALFLPALRVRNDVSAGWNLFVIGPLGLLAGYPDWLGNLALLAAQAVIWLHGPRAWRVGTAVALLISALIAVTRRALPMDEGGSEYAIQAWLPGFYLWLASLLLPVGFLLRTVEEDFS